MDARAHHGGIIVLQHSGLRGFFEVLRTPPAVEKRKILPDDMSFIPVQNP
ncbi:hypothetical protein [Burkholderia contaminans]|nr:hypothetical protein [Burkholderia contaminans]